MPQTLDVMLAPIHALLPLQERDVDTFLELVAGTVDLGDPRFIKPLLMLVDDNCPLSGVMDAVLRNLEEFPSDVYVRELLAFLPAFYERSPFWCENEVKKRLWTEREREALIAGLPTATDQAKKCLRAILTRVKQETPQLEDACADVMTRL